MKPPFVSSGGATPAPTSQVPKPGGLGGALPDLPGGLPGLPGGLPGLPDLPDLPELPDLPDLPTCLPGSCDALWNAVDKGIAPITGALDNATKAATGAKDKALKAAEEAKDKAVKAASDAKDKAVKAVDEVKDKAAKAAQDAKDKASKAVDEASEAVKRNAEIAKKYAELYLSDPKQAWAGLASIVTQQAGCPLQDALKEARKLADEAAGKAGQYVDDAGRMVDEAGQSVADGARSAEKAATGLAKDGMDTLADTKKKVFESIYPVTKFYEDNGLDKLTECGSIPGRPEVPAALTDALEQIDKGTDEGIRAGSDMIAQYEQNSIVEKAIYEGERYRDQGMTELAAMADKMKSGLTDAIPLSDMCGGPPVPFDGLPLDPGAAERYYHKLMDEFEKMGKDAKDKMINEIAKQGNDAKDKLMNAIPKPGMPDGKSVGF